MADNIIRVTRYLNNNRLTHSSLSDGMYYSFLFNKEISGSKIIIEGVCPNFGNNNDGSYLYTQIDGERKYTGVLENPNSSAGTDQAAVIRQTWRGLSPGIKQIKFGWAAYEGSANIPWLVSHPNSTDDARNPQTGSEWIIWEIDTTDEPRVSATGGDRVFVSGGYKYHVFTSTGTSNFVVTNPGHVEYVVLAGGGAGGGGDVGGGGGAGGMRTNVPYTISGQNSAPEPAMFVGNGTYVVTVGSGGVGVQNSGAKGGDGGSSSFNGIVALGGGGGSGWSAGAANSGGCGGGGVTSSAGSGTQSQGFSGGTGLGGGNYPEGGGGGIGSIGETAPDQSRAGNGGRGLPNPMQAPQIGQWIGGIYYIGGGGGGGVESNATTGLGGIGGGGTGGRQSSDTSCTAGLPNTGGGGGGEDPQAGCNGGSGVVILRYEI